MNSEILTIVGPTASGKTEWGLSRAAELGGEIISADSRQVYRFLSTGTAKPQGLWRASHYVVQGISYHLVDIWDPAESFSAAHFVQLARLKIEDIRLRGKQPILVGGTGLYLKALEEGLAPLPPRNEELRKQFAHLAATQGRRILHGQLAQVDPEAAHLIPINHLSRVIRALEVHRLTGKPISQWHREHRKKASSSSNGAGGIRLKAIGITMERQRLYKRIAERCEWMLTTGMIQETETLLKKGYPPNAPALTGLGYSRVVAYLRGELTRGDLLDLLIRDTRHYAKRQMTWFRNRMSVEWKTF